LQLLQQAFINLTDKWFNLQISTERIFNLYFEFLKGLSNIFFLQCEHMSLMDFMVSPPGCGRNVTDFCGWEAQEAQLRCPDEVDGDI
jgi:hypothetical protein